MHAEPWFLEAESLLGRIARLTSDEDILEAVNALDADLEVARSRIHQLEHLAATLEIELYRLKYEKPSQGRAGVVITAIIAAASGFLGGVGTGVGTAAYNQMVGIKEHATQLAITCNVRLDALPVEVTATPLSADLSASAQVTAKADVTMRGPAQQIDVGSVPDTSAVGGIEGIRSVAPARHLSDSARVQDSVGFASDHGTFTVSEGDGEGQ